MCSCPPAQRQFHWSVSHTYLAHISSKSQCLGGDGGHGPWKRCHKSNPHPLRQTGDMPAPAHESRIYHYSNWAFQETIFVELLIFSLLHCCPWVKGRGHFPFDLISHNCPNFLRQFILESVCWHIMCLEVKHCLVNAVTYICSRG